jgi:hypothetical protein
MLLAITALPTKFMQAVAQYLSFLSILFIKNKSTFVDAISMPNRVPSNLEIS